MSTLLNLQQSYMDGLKVITGKSSIRKVTKEKKDDPPVRAFGLYDPKLGSKQKFPITRTMLVMSFIFWFALVYLVYVGISYGLLYGRITREGDLAEKCGDAFIPDKRTNAARVESYPVGEAGPYLLRIHSEKQEDVPMESPKLPPIMTGITSGQFYEVQGLIHHLNENKKDKQSDLDLYIYDLGLNEKERELIEKYCHCNVRDFDFDIFPPHVRDVSNFAWRPIILQLMLEEFGSVMYVEPATRFKSSDSSHYLRMRGSKNYFLWDSLKFVSLIAYTEYEMFTFLNETRCAFADSSLISPEAIVLYRTKTTWDELMKPWLKCVLNAGCISPASARYSGCIEARHPKTTGCHRYDMSALSIILNRGVQYTIDREKMVSFRLTHTVTAHNNYFPEQPWTYTHFVFLILLPVVIFLAYKFICKRRRRFK